jgi:hypothetical protein
MSKAVREALSLASSDAIQALADARASILQQRKKRSQVNSKKEAYRTSKDKTKEFTFRKLSPPSDTWYTQCPRRRISSSMPGKGRMRKNIDCARKTSQGNLLTLSGETADSWASREASVSLDFFDRLVLRVTGIFLIEDLVVLGACIAGSTSCAKGSSRVAARVEGASTTSFCGSLSSLQEETSFIQPNRI